MTAHLDDRQISQLIDGDLSLTERSAALAHLSHCPGCARRQSELVEVTATLRSERRLEWSSRLTDRVLTQIGSPAHSRRRSPLPLAASLAVVAAGFALVVALVAPWGPFIADAVFDPVAALPPVSVGSAQGALIALIAVALLAPAVVYPLARWR